MEQRYLLKKGNRYILLRCRKQNGFEPDPILVEMVLPAENVVQARSLVVKAYAERARAKGVKPYPYLIRNWRRNANSAKVIYPTNLAEILAPYV